LLWGSGDISLLNKDSKFSHEVFALILMEIKISLNVKCESFVEDWLEEFGKHLF
jgi:hypothetical protein